MTLLETIVQHLQAGSGKRVTLRVVADALELDRRQVLRVLDKLAGEGYLREIADKQEPPKHREMGPARRNPTWQIIRDLADRPAQNRPRNNSLRSKLWRLIRAKLRFTKPELARCAGSSMATADEYVRDLERAGYVRRTGKDGRLTVYMLVKINQIEPPTGVYGGGK